jgi:hypothetical protein
LAKTENFAGKHVPHDERVEALPEVALPARHPGDVRLHRGVAVRLPRQIERII